MPGNKFQVQLFILDQRVDLLEETSINIQSKIQDVRDVKKVFTDFSHEFTIPASKNNNRVLQHMMRSDASGLDPRAFHSAYIEINNTTFRRGYVIINRGTVRSGVVNSYSVKFYGGLVNLTRRLQDDYLIDLDALSQYDIPFGTNRDSIIRSLLTNTPGTAVTGVDSVITDNLAFCLNAFDQGYYYDSTTTTEREGYYNMYYRGNTTDNETFNGVRTNELKPSLRNSAIISAIEDQYEDIRFSRGLDADGRPTSIASEVVTSHFLNTSAFTDSYTLLHQKNAGDALNDLPQLDIAWDTAWGPVNAIGPGSDDNASNRLGTNNIDFGIFYENDERPPLLSNTYFLDVDVTKQGTGAYILKLINSETGDEIWSSGVQSQSYRASEDPSLDYMTNLDLVNGGQRNGLSGGSIQNGNGSVNWDGVANGFEIIPPEVGLNPLRFVAQVEDGVRIEVSATIYNERRTNFAGILGIRNFERNVRRSSNTYAAGSVVDTFSVGSGAPRIKVIDYLTGWWKMANLTAYVDVDAQGRLIIVTQELDQYYSSGETIDITQYTDSQEYTIEAPTFYNPIIFKYSDPSTFLAREFLDQQRARKRYGYGSLSYDRFDNDPELEDRVLPYREYKVEIPFEQVVLTGVNDEADQDFNSNIVYGWIVNDSRAPTDMKPWIHYIENTAATTGWLLKDSDGNHQVTNYNTATKTLFDADGTEVQSLTFDQENIERQTYAEGVGVETNVTLFSSYYRDYIRSVFNNRARIFKVRARFPRGIITRLGLDDSVIIGDRLMRINEMQINTSNGDAILELISLDNTLALDAVDPPEVITDLHIASFTNNLFNGSLVLPTLTLNVLASGGTTPYSYRWVKNGMILEGETTSTLEDDNPMTGDTYSVTVTDAAGTSVTSTTLTIQENQSPTVSISSNVANPAIGSRVTLTALVIDPERDLFDIQWQQDGVNIPGATNVTYTVDSWAVTNNGSYTAIVTPRTGNRTQITSDALSLTARTLTGVSLNLNAITGLGADITVTVSGDIGTPFRLDIQNTTPTGWLTNAGISNTIGVIGEDGTATATLMIPAATMTVDRTAELIATNTDAITNTVSSGLFRQQHTQTSDGDLVVGFSDMIVGTMATFSYDITAGDQPFTVELFDTDPRIGTQTPIQTQTQTSTGTYSFMAIDVGSFDPGDYTYYLRVSDQDGDIIVESETITVSDEASFDAAEWNSIYEGTEGLDRLPWAFYAPSGRTFSVSISNSDGTELQSTFANPSQSAFTVDMSDLRADAGENLSLVVTRTDVSPNIVVFSHTFIYNRMTAVFSDTELSPIVYSGTSARFFSNASDGADERNTLYPSYGYDYATGDVDNVPEGENRVTEDFGLFVGNQFSVNTSTLQGEEITIRPWVSSVDPPTNAGGTIIYGPIRVITIP